MSQVSHGDGSPDPLSLPLPKGAQAEDRYDDEADASDDARGRRPDEGIRHSD